MLLAQPAEVPDSRLARLLPDFLVISPPKTGSTWLAANLRRHPGLFIPDIKEIKYFNSLYQWLDLDWYRNHFRPAGERRKGEASPSYAVLPVEGIRRLHRLMPSVKLIYLMREPMARAWSHARHNRAFREANFSACPRGDSTTAAQWRANFTHDWPLFSGDYLGQLRRWLSVFPAEQVYVGFYESIATEPEALLRRLFGFLGVDADVDLSSFPVFERILAGNGEELPDSLTRPLHRLWSRRTAELAEFLAARFGLRPPAEWQRCLAPVPEPMDGEDSCEPPVFPGDCADSRLVSLLAQEEAFPTAYRTLLVDYFGYKICFYRGELFALAHASGVQFPPEDPVERELLEGRGECFHAPTLAEVKDQVVQFQFARAQGRIETLESELRDARGRAAVLEGKVDECCAALRQVEAKAFGLASPNERALVGAFRACGRGTLRVWRRVAALLT